MGTLAGNYFGGIVKSGLVLVLDAAKKDSYPRVGTTWSDISGNNTRGTLTNGAFFDGDNYGNIVFDGNNDYVELGAVPVLQFINTQPFSYSIWCRWSGGTSSNIIAYALLSGSGFANRGYYMGIDNGTLGVCTNCFYFDYYDGSSFRGIQSANNSIPANNTWFNITYTSDSSNFWTGLKIYLNGILMTTGARAGGAGTPSTINYAGVTAQVGARQGQYTFKGRIGQVLGYNKELRSQEVYQNYNALVSRYLTTTSFDTDAQAFITAAGITGTTQQSAINQLVIDLKVNSLWTKMKVIYPFVGGTATTHKFNLKDPRDLDAAFRLGFVGGWTHDSLGAKPNGVNTYALTYLTTPNSQFTFSNVHSSYYNVTNSAGGSAFPNGKTEIGAGSTNTVMSIFVGTDTTMNVGGSCGGFISATYSLGNGADPRGFVNVSRTSSTLIKTIRNGVVVATNTTGVSNLPFTADLNIGCNYFSDGATQRNQFSDRQAAFISFGSGLSDDEAAVFYTIVQNYQTRLGRQV